MGKTNHFKALAATLAAVRSLVLMMLVLDVQPAEATFPGKNGKIAYSGHGGLYTISPHGRGKTKVAEGLDPSYSPNGKKIAYSKNDGNDLEIYTIKATGGRPFQLTNNLMEDYDPSWSPHGKKIAYTHYSDADLPDEAAAIYKIAADGGREVLVTDNNGTGGLYPSWGAGNSGCPLRQPEKWRNENDFSPWWGSRP